MEGIHSPVTSQISIMSGSVLEPPPASGALPTLADFDTNDICRSSFVRLFVCACLFVGQGSRVVVC